MVVDQMETHWRGSNLGHRRTLPTKEFQAGAASFSSSLAGLCHHLSKTCHRRTPSTGWESEGGSRPFGKLEWNGGSYGGGLGVGSLAVEGGKPLCGLVHRQDDGIGTLGEWTTQRWVGTAVQWMVEEQ